MSEPDSLEALREKLEYLRREELIAPGGSRKFGIGKEIEAGAYIVAKPARLADYVAAYRRRRGELLRRSEPEMGGPGNPLQRARPLPGGGAALPAVPCDYGEGAWRQPSATYHHLE